MKLLKKQPILHLFVEISIHIISIGKISMAEN